MENRQTIVLNYLKKILEVDKNEDYINELFESRMEDILYNFGEIATIKKYNEEIRIIEDKMKKKLENAMTYIHYVDNYSMILKSKEVEIQSILYRYGINDGIKILEGKFEESCIRNVKKINEQTIERLLHERLDEIIEQINNSELAKEINDQLRKFENEVDDNLKNEALVKEYKELEKNIKKEYEKLIYIVGIYDVMSILYEGKQENKINLL